MYTARLLPLILLPWLSACSLFPKATAQVWSGGERLPDVELSHAPFDELHINWKQRLAEPYIYLEHHGDYRLAGGRIQELLSLAHAQKAPIHGAPFILFYDDPGSTAQAQLRARVGIAIDGDFASMAPLQLDTMPAETVAYAAIAGAYSEVPRSYPGIFGYLKSRGWQPRTPIRETYLVSPVGKSPEELICEVQIPWVPGG